MTGIVQKELLQVRGGSNLRSGVRVKGKATYEPVAFE